MQTSAVRSILVGLLSANMVFAPQVLAQPGTTIPNPPGGDHMDPTRPRPAPQPPADIDPRVAIPVVLSSLFGLSPTSAQQNIFTSATAGIANFPLSILDAAGASVGSATFDTIVRSDIDSVSEAITEATGEACTELAVARPAPMIQVFTVAGSISTGTQSKIINAIGVTFFLDDAVATPSTLTVLVPFAIQTNAPAAIAENGRAAADLQELGEQVAARGGEGPCDFSSAAYVNGTPAEKCLYAKKCAYGRAWAEYDLAMAAAMGLHAGAAAGCLASTIVSPLCLAGVAATFAVTAGVLRLSLSRARTRADEDYCKCLVDAGLPCDGNTGVSAQ